MDYPDRTPRDSSLTLVATLISALTDALNLRYLREELFEAPLDRSSDEPLVRPATPFDVRQRVLQFAHIETAAKYPRSQFDVGVSQRISQ
jgi:hypothetical protein